MASQTDQGVNFRTNMHVSFLLQGENESTRRALCLVKQHFPGSNFAPHLEFYIEVDTRGILFHYNIFLLWWYDHKKKGPKPFLTVLPNGAIQHLLLPFCKEHVQQRSEFDQICLLSSVGEDLL